MWDRALSLCGTGLGQTVYSLKMLAGLPSVPQFLSADQGAGEVKFQGPLVLVLE